MFKVLGYASLVGLFMTAALPASASMTGVEWLTRMERCKQRRDFHRRATFDRRERWRRLMQGRVRSTSFISSCEVPMAAYGCQP